MHDVARFSERIKALFPRLPILLLLHGLYANGWVMQRCRQYHWQFMVVLKDKDLPTVWEELHALHALQPNCFHRHWGRRRQRFCWVNAIDDAFGQRGRRPSASMWWSVKRLGRWSMPRATP